MNLNASSKIMLSSGNDMPIIGLGTWQLTHNTPETIKRAIDLGYRMIDTSSDYGTQPSVGEAVAACGLDRQDLYIVAKVEETDNAYRATKDYLKEMGLEYADLMLIHRPPQHGAGVALWSGLIRAKVEGLTHDIGVSNYSTDQIDELIEATNEVPTVNQIEWSPYGNSPEMYDYCNDNEIVIQAYSPLTRAKELTEPRLVAIAKKYGKTPAQILIRWNIQQDVVPLPKANHLEHLAENINVFDFDIDDDDMSELNSFNEHFSALKGLAYV